MTDAERYKLLATIHDNFDKARPYLQAARKAAEQLPEDGDDATLRHDVLLAELSVCDRWGHEGGE